MQMLRGFAVLALASVAAAPAPAAAPGDPPPAAARPDALKPVFDALPEADRRALQDALTWTGDFNGAVAGTYGPRTRDALLAYARRGGLTAGTALDGPARRRLLAEAEAARRAAGFTRLHDARAALTIGVPSRLLTVRTPLPDGTRYAAPDGSAVLDTAGRGGGPEALEEVLGRLTRDVPGRRVTYRLARHDVIVVAGEAGDRRFYSRYAVAAPPGGEPALRGFTLTYPAARAADFDRIVLAVAAAFDPAPLMPQPDPGPPPTATTAAAVAAAASAADGKPPVLVGAAVLVAPGLALTRADPRSCPEPAVDGAPARWTRQDAASGLALLAVAAHGTTAVLPLAAAAAPVSRRYGLFFVPGEGAPALAVALAGGDEAGFAELPLQGADAGVPLVDGAGALAGLTAAPDIRPPSVAGTVVAGPYRVTGPGQIGAFLRDAGVATTAPIADDMAGPGAALARWRPVVVPLRCRAPA